MATSFEGMIGRALLGDEKEKALQMARVETKWAVMQTITCRCGSVLDQKTAVVVGANDRALLTACPDCVRQVADKLPANAELTCWKGKLSPEQWVEATTPRKPKNLRTFHIHGTDGDQLVDGEIVPGTKGAFWVRRVGSHWTTTHKKSGLGLTTCRTKKQTIARTRRWWALISDESRAEFLKSNSPTLTDDDKAAYKQAKLDFPSI